MGRGPSKTKVRDASWVGSPFADLTPREHQVCRLLCLGLPNAAIAREIGRGVKTVDTHRMHIMGKTLAVNNTQLLRMAIAWGYAGVPRLEAEGE